MTSIPRLVVVDPQHEIARIVRGAVALLARQVVLVDVPDAAEALEEIDRVQVDLLVTAATLPGEMNGLELADAVSHMSLATPVIVLATQDDPRPDPDWLRQQPFQYFVRPVAEPFLRGMRIALDGLPVVHADEAQAVSQELTDDVPRVDLKALRALMLPLMRDVGAMGVILADRLGRVLIDEGATGYLDRERLAALLGPSFGRMGQVAELVGGRPWAMQYIDGERIDLYALSLGLHYFLCLMFEGSNRAAMGAVAVYGRRAAERMIEVMGEAAFAVPEPAPTALELETERPREAAPAPVAPVEQHAPVEANDEPPLDPLPDDAFDPDALFSQPVDEALADSMFDPDTLGELAESFGEDGSGRVDLDAARDLGLIGD
jgi:predicted regulator of Ras-like GTPase activity (Roadblock/LC7/MglB family)